MVAELAKRWVMEDGRQAAIAAEQAMLRCDVTLFLTAAVYLPKWVWRFIEITQY